MVSDPRKLLLSPPSNLQRCVRALRKVSGIQDYSPVDPHDTDRWPHTVILRETFHPNWKDAEIHCAVKTHHKDGRPINLGGAILHIFLFKDNGRQVNEVIGSYPVNLEYLFRLCAKIDASEHEHAGSWRDLTHETIKKKASHHGGTLYDSANDKMISLDIGRPFGKSSGSSGKLDQITIITLILSQKRCTAPVTSSPHVAFWLPLSHCHCLRDACSFQ